MKSSLSFAEAWFAVSLLVFAFGYGFASHAWGLFPKTYVEQAWRQVWAVSVYFSNENKRPDTYNKFYDREGIRIPLPEKVQPGLTSVTSSWKDSAGFKDGAKLIDQKGNVLHEWLFDREELFSGYSEVKGNPEKAWISSSYVLPGGDLAVILGYVGMARLDACGDVRWTLSEGIHHWGTEPKMERSGFQPQVQNFATVRSDTLTVIQG